ncbi:casparian strip membrane protein 1-like [Andrographis paniculata]|uniref:casparian strip membrane protein 1-like n=1 Tax=Andrographis paniculata TaxID=175694 RepID=UPI0021E82449|nr:casparian strip membrane protein 1-like [Andrographis paniculata]
MEKSDAATIEIAETSRERKGKLPFSGAPAAALGRVKAARGHNRGIGIFDLILRICAAVTTLAAAVAMATAEETLPFFTQFFQFDAGYDDMPTFSFFVIAMAIVTGYLFLSVPFSIVCIIRPIATGPRMLLMLFDTMMLTLATSASAAAAAIVYLAHNGNSSANWLAICQLYSDFCQKVSGAAVAGFVGVGVLILLVLASAIAMRRH